MLNLDNSTLLITGGTGSFGNEVLRLFLKSNVSEIRIFSRDEKKQDDMRKHYNDPRLKFFIGDVRDSMSIRGAMQSVDYVFHAAALKQVPSCEFYPIEAVKTNILGTENVLNAALDSTVKKVVCLSTDKAVYPVNAMGLSKSLMEKVLIAKSREGGSSTIICGTRYGNVMGSRGSVIPLFIDQINKGIPLTITSPKMTRFIMSLEEAVDLVMYAFINGKAGDIFVQKSPSAYVEHLAMAISRISGNKDYPIEIIGKRHGEKMYETLISAEEMPMANEIENFFRIHPDARDLNYSQFFDEGHDSIISEEYNSNNTEILSLEDVESLIRKQDFVSALNKQ
ncbi:polysaccharide biosynthesis protein [Gammaproteobacteria bacterium]|nr:polysaccharide biosynthesis protein [Gammaproteobacteria bacterium]